ncbi:MAG: hypothetical protein MJ016_05840, partial [Victivallaceae bacterium]|nr:hypothetical protein [Victivallaceae bacterium]
IPEDDQPETLLVRRASDGSRLLALVNTGYDAIKEVRLRIAAKPGEVKQLAADGKWSDVETRFADGILTVPRKLECYETLVLRIR